MEPVWSWVARSSPPADRRGPDEHQGLGGQAVHEHPAGELGGEEHRGRRGQEADAGDQGGVALDVLQELGEEEDDPVHPRVAETAGHVGGGPGAVGQDPQREDGLGCGGLDAHEQAQQGDAGEEGSDRDGRRPAGRSGFDQAQHDGGHPGSGGDCAGQIEPAVPAFGLDQHRPTDEEDGQADGDVDEHDPAP